MGLTQRLSAAGLVALLVSACDVIGPSPTPASVEFISPTGSDPAVGSSLTAQVKVTDSSGKPIRGANVQWAAVAGTVSPTTSRTDTEGVASATWVLGTKAGEQVLIATVEALPQARLAVQALTGPVAVVTITPSSDSLTLGETKRLTATAADQYGNPITQGIVFTAATAADTNFVRVASNGAITGRAPGTATVVARAGAESAHARITVQLGAAQISAGAYSACGVLRTGEALCWGSNTYGQLGNGTTDASSIPVRVAGGHTFVSISVGQDHACAVTAQGAAYCWGSNYQGRLGRGSADTCHGVGSTPCSTTPLQVLHQKFRSVSAGGQHTCGISDEGEGICWGFNGYGQLGNGSTNDTQFPTRVSGGLRFASLSAGAYHTCGVTENNVAYCWGSNRDGRLGNGSTADQWNPTRVAGDVVYGSISAGADHTCARSTVNTVYCWGSNADGKLGTGSTDFPTHLTPVRIAGGAPYQAISAGARHTCSVHSTTEVDGTGHCWGSNTYGQLGDGTGSSTATPKPVAGGRLFRSISAGLGLSTCGITREHQAYCWGSNASGQLGDGTTASSLAPVQVKNFGS